MRQKVREIPITWRLAIALWLATFGILGILFVRVAGRLLGLREGWDEDPR